MHYYKHDIKKVFFAAAVSAVIVAILLALDGNYASESTGVFSTSVGSWVHIAKLQVALL